MSKKLFGRFKDKILKASGKILAGSIISYCTSHLWVDLFKTNINLIYQQLNNSKEISHDYVDYNLKAGWLSDPLAIQANNLKMRYFFSSMTLLSSAICSVILPLICGGLIAWGVKDLVSVLMDGIKDKFSPNQKISPLKLSQEQTYKNSISYIVPDSPPHRAQIIAGNSSRQI